MCPWCNLPDSSIFSLLRGASALAVFPCCQWLGQWVKYYGEHPLVALVLDAYNELPATAASITHLFSISPCVSSLSLCMASDMLLLSFIVGEEEEGGIHSIPKTVMIRSSAISGRIWIIAPVFVLTVINNDQTSSANDMILFSDPSSHCHCTETSCIQLFPVIL